MNAPSYENVDQYKGYDIKYRKRVGNEKPHLYEFIAVNEENGTRTPPIDIGAESIDYFMADKSKLKDRTGQDLDEAIISGGTAIIKGLLDIAEDSQSPSTGSQ
jgi:hypothetical protein